LQNNDRDEYDVVRESISGPQLELDLRTHSADLVLEQSPVALGSAALLEGEVGLGFVNRRNRYRGSDPGFLPDYDEQAGGVFALERIVWERIELQAGVRYDAMARSSRLDDRTFLPFRAQGRLPQGCDETEEGAVCQTPFHAPSGSLGVVVRPVATVPELVVSLNASTAVRFPNSDEQFIKGAAPSFPVFSNGDGTLTPERTWTGSSTVSYANRWAFAEASAFGSFIDDYIYFRFQPQQDDDPSGESFSDCAPLQCGVQGAFPLFAPEAVDALFYGGEVAGTVQPPRWPVLFDAQASWVRGQQLAGGQPLTFVPPDHYDLGVTYQWPDLGRSEDGHVGLRGSFVDRQRRSDPDADFAPPPPGYVLLGAEAGIAVPLGEQRLAFSLTGRNLTNARYRDYTSLLRYYANEPGWDVLLRISLDFATAG
ncbi:MAG: TonB-dependent receptor, partial [Nannocystaceae bacterium]|nr:TonB-dependent receptor [Nannocystaceae bacterium]